MTTKDTMNLPLIRRRDVCFGALAFGATSGTSLGHFLIVGPNWKGTPPAGIKETFRSAAAYDGSCKVPPVRKVLDVTVGKGTP
jgi:hypothetical protein